MSHSLRVRLIEGHFQDKFRECRNCGARWVVYEEKEADVNIAIAMPTDAARDVYDTALLISADSDLRPAIAAVKRLRVGKRIVAAFPLRRRSKDLAQAVEGYSDALFVMSNLPGTAERLHEGWPVSRND